MNRIPKRYAANIAKPDRPKDKIFKDVIEVNLQLNQKDLEMLTGELSVFEYKFSHEGNKKICIGPDVKFIVTLIESGHGKITGIKISCHSNQHKKETFEFGEKSRLVLHAGNTATWIF
jgi:hypothetical protein